MSVIITTAMQCDICFAIFGPHALKNKGRAYRFKARRIAREEGWMRYIVMDGWAMGDICQNCKSKLRRERVDKHG